jgi:tetratricopeptide (TPR) repeat protein
MPASEDGLAALFRTRLAGRAVLLLLDNARDAAQVRPLLPGSSTSAVIVTARSRMPDLASTKLVDLEVFDDDESKVLFARIVGEERAAEEPESTAEVLASCAGMPLAIRICAARLAARSRWSIQSMAERLRARLLDELKIGDMAVRASFQVSFDSLPDEGEPARTFRLLGLWQGPFISLPAAAALLGRDEHETAEALETLIDAYLLESLAPDRYGFHDLLRIYAAERVQTEESARDRDAAVRRLLHWYLHTVDAAATRISPLRSRPPLPEAPRELRPLTFDGPDSAMDWLESEHQNIVAATRTAAAEGLNDVAWLLPASALAFFNRRGYDGDWITTHELALASVRKAGDRAGEAQVLNNLGLAYSRMDPRSGVRYLEQALEIRRGGSDLSGVARTWSNLLDTYLLLGRFTEVIDQRDDVLRVQREAGEVNSEGVALSNIGEAYLGLGQIPEAVECLRLAGEIFGRTGDSRGEANVLQALGDAYLAQERTDDALASYQRAVETFHSIRDRREAPALLRLGRACGQAGLTADARAYLSRADALFRALGDERQAAALRSELTEILPEGPDLR